MLFDDYYQLSEIFDDDIEKVAKVIQRLSVKKYIITNIRNDLLDYTEINHKKYIPAIQKALDLPIKELRLLAENKPRSTMQPKIIIELLIYTLRQRKIKNKHFYQMYIGVGHD